MHPIARLIFTGTLCFCFGSSAFAQYKVNSGGGAVSPFTADANFSGGTTASTTATINLTGVTSPAPAAVYQTERYGNSTYTFGSLTADTAYTVRLHFAETWHSAAGLRKFDVSINGTQVLNDYDIYAAAGAKNKAVITQHTANANASGQIVIQFTNVVENAKINGIEIIGGSTPNGAPTVSITSPANNATYNAPASIGINAAASDSDGSVSNVQFLTGTTSLGTDTTSPYSITWSNVASGSYSLTAKATDNVGAVTTSSTINITVNSSATASPGTGTGLKGEYFDNMDFTALKVTRTDATVNFDWATGTPDPTVAGDTFSVRWTGQVQAQFSQTYTFYTTTDDGVRLWVNNTLLIDKWVNQGTTEWSGTIALAAGTRYDIKMEYFDSTGGAVARLSWSSPSTAKAIIPQTQLYPAASSANTLPTVNITSPASGAVFTAPASVVINASASDADGTVSSVQFLAGTTSIGTDTSSPYTITWSNVPSGVYSLTAKATDNAGAVSTSSAVSVTVNASSSSSTVAWQGQDIGTVGAAGSFSIASGVFTVKGSGADIWGAADAFHYVYTTLNGDGQLVARVTSMTPAIINSKAGVMIRSTLSNNSIHFLMNVTPDGQAQFLRRTTAGGTTSFSGGNTIAFPYYLKIERRGSTFIGSISSDGKTWTLVGSDTAALGSSLFIGMAVCARQDGTLLTSTFDNVTLSPGSLPAVSITSPADGSTLPAASNVAITATASDADGITRVEFYNRSTLLGTDATSPYSINWNSVADGYYKLKALAYDGSGASAFSSIVNITVGNPPPLHPRLLFSSADLAGLRSKIQTEPFLSMFNKLKADAENGQGPDFGAFSAGDAWGESCNAMKCAFLYALTGDDTWAQKAKTYVQNRINATSNQPWASTSTKGLLLFFHGKSVAQAYDWCYSAPSWDAAFRATVSAKLKQQGDVIHDNGGTEQNADAASNWQANRWSSAGLCYLATDDDYNPASLTDSYNKVNAYLTANYSTDTGARGWNIEALGYAMYPWSHIGPFGIAMKRFDASKDILATSPAVKYALWSVYAATCRITKKDTTLFGIHPDFSNDNPVLAGEGAYGLAYYYCPSTLHPGLSYWYKRMVGASGDRSYDNARAGTIYSILYYNNSVAEQNPMAISDWLNAFIENGGNGMFTYRNKYQDKDDLVGQFYVKRRGNRGHNGPDALSFRILGLDTAWGVGGGRYGGTQINGQDPYLRSMNTLYPVDPASSSTKITINGNSGSIIGTPVIKTDGSGHLVASISANNVNTLNHKRRFIANYSTATGAQGAYIISDTSDNGKYWQFCTLSENTVTTSGNTFTITSVGGNTLKGTVLYPSGATLTTGTRQRGNAYSYHGADFIDNKYVVCSTSTDGDYLVVLTLVKSGQVQPAVSATGTWSGATPNGTVRVGSLSVSINGDAITH